MKSDQSSWFLQEENFAAGWYVAVGCAADISEISAAVPIMYMKLYPMATISICRTHPSFVCNALVVMYIRQLSHFQASLI